MKTENIILLTRDKVFLYIPADAKFKNCSEYSNYNSATLSGVLEKIVASHNLHHFGILLNNEVSYITSLNVDANKKDKEIRETVSKRLPEKIPSISDNLVWDYKIIKTGGLDNVQVAGVDKHFLEIVLNALDSKKLKPEFIEPLAYAFTKLETKEKEFAGLYFSNYEKILFVVNNGLLIYTANIAEGQLKDSIEVFNNYIRSKFPTKNPMPFFVEEIGHKLSEEETKYLASVGFAVEEKNFSKYIFAIPEDLKIKKDSESLVLKEDRPHKPGFVENLLKKTKKNDGKPKNHTKLLVIMLVLLLLGGSVFILKYLADNSIITVPFLSKQNQVFEETVTTPTPTPTPEPTVEKITETKFENFIGYKIEVLNGSGVRGEADKVTALLAPLEFDEVSVGNASSYNYQESEVSFKTAELYRGIELIEKALPSYALLFSEEPLPEDYPYDIRIIVGKTRLIEKGLDVETTPMITPTGTIIPSPVAQ